MTNWQKKRNKTKMTRSDMAEKLGIPYDRYVLIEKGDVKMPTNLIDKFNSIVNKKKGEHKLEKMNNEKIVNDWWNEISQKREDGKFKLMEILEEYNIGNLASLGRLLGYRDGSNLSAQLNGNAKPSYDFRNKVYLFLHNELNIQPPKDKKIEKKEKQKRKYTRKPKEEPILSFDGVVTKDNKEFVCETKMPELPKDRDDYCVQEAMYCQRIEDELTEADFNFNFIDLKQHLESLKNESQKEVDTYTFLIEQCEVLINKYKIQLALHQDQVDLCEKSLNKLKED